MRESRLAATISALLALLLLVSPVGAMSFDVARVADLNTAIPAGTGNFTGLNSSFAQSGNNVAFRGLGSAGQLGIYLFAGSTLTRVTDMNTAIPAGTGTFANFGLPALSGSTVAFRGTRGFQQEGIYLFAGNTLSRVADLNTAIPAGQGNFESFGTDPVLSGGNVAFRAGGSGQEGIYIFGGGNLRRVADRRTGIPSGTGTFTFFTPPAVSGGNVAFRGFGSAGQDGIYLFAGGSLRRVADTKTAIPDGTGTFTRFSPLPRLSGDTVAFRGIGSGQDGIYLFAGGRLSRVANLNTAIPGGAGTFTGFSDFPEVSGGKAAFLALGSGQVGAYFFADGTLNHVADLNTAIPDGASTFTDFTEPLVSEDALAFRGLGSSEQAGIYLFAGSELSAVADRNTAIPDGAGTFTSFGRPVLSGGNVAYFGTGSSGQGIYLARPSAGLTRFQGSGKAQNVGSGRDNGNVRISGQFDLPDVLALDRATLTLTDVLNEVAGRGELTTGSGGGHPVPLELEARAGSKPTSAIYQTASGVKPSVTVEIKNRDPRTRLAEFSITVDRARVSTPDRCAEGPTASTQLETSFELQVGTDRVLVDAVLSWRCLRGQLSTP